MSLLDDARDAADREAQGGVPVAEVRTDAATDTEGDADAPESDTATDTTRTTSGATATLTRESSVMIDGAEIDVEGTDTIQTADGDPGSWLSGGEKYGRPRGNRAVQNRQIARTAPMQSIANGIAGQILGGELTFEGRDDVLENLSDAEQDAAADLRALMRDVLEGPHLPDRSLDQMMVAAIHEMLGVGQAIWHRRAAADGSLPVVALEGLDPLTVRLNVNEHNEWQDPPYWQVPAAFSQGSVPNLKTADPVPLGHDDIYTLDWPYGTRDNLMYPESPAEQVREWLEVLANSVTHHNRYYDDNQLPAGLLQVVNASDQTVDTIKSKVKDAASDPRRLPVVGGEAPANFVEMAGTAINLDIIQEQQWFFEMCLGALGLGKAEVGLIEDVNRSNGKIEATRVYKRIGGPVSSQFESAFRWVADHFDAYRDLGRPFVPTLSFTDPREERAQREQLRKDLESGTLTPRQYARRTGNDDLAEDPDAWTVDLPGGTVNYGDLPKWVAKRKMAALGATDPDPDPDAGGGAGAPADGDGAGAEGE